MFTSLRNSIDFDSLDDLISILDNERKINIFSIKLYNGESKIKLVNLSSVNHAWKIKYSSDSYEGLKKLKNQLEDCEPLLLCKKDISTFIQKYNYFILIFFLFFILMHSAFKWVSVSTIIKSISLILAIFSSIIEWYIIFESPYKNKRVGKLYFFYVLKYLLGLILAGIIGAILTIYINSFMG